MKVGLVTTRLQNSGGQFQLLHLARNLIKQGHEVCIYSVDDTIIDIDRELIEKIQIKSCRYKLPTSNKPRHQIDGFILHIWYLVKGTALLVKLLFAEDLDILNPHDYPVHWACCIIRFIKGTRVVWMCNEIWHIPGKEIYPEKRIIFYIGNRILGIGDRFLTHFFINEIVVLDNRIKRIVTKFYNRNVTLVRSGIDLKKYKNLPHKDDARKAVRIPQNKIIFLCLQAFHPHRRFEDAILAFHLLLKKSGRNDIMLFIVGSDKFEKGYVKSLEKEIYKYKLDQYIQLRTDYIPEDMIVNYLMSSDIFVFPNSPQTWGIVVIESMSCKKPCIVSSNAGVHEVIQDGKNGIIFQGRNVNELMIKMEVLLNDNLLRRTLGKNGRQFVFENFSWEKYSESMLNIFNHVLNHS